MMLTLVQSPLRDLAERERRIKILAQLSQRDFFHDIAMAKWRQARNGGASERVVELLGHWVSGFEQ